LGVKEKPYQDTMTIRPSVTWYQRLNRLSSFREILLKKDPQQAQVL
jgi:hypothetical protein